MIKVGIITVSDRSSQGLRQDLSGPAIKEVLENYREFKVIKYIIVPDEEKVIVKNLKQLIDKLNLDLVFTTGGTGLSKRDVTPEATKKVIQKEIPGIPEAMRQISLKFSPNAILSRALAGLRAESLIVNLPGNPAAVKQILPEILSGIIHGIKIIKGLKE